MSSLLAPELLFYGHMKSLIFIVALAFCSTSFGESAVLSRFMNRECSSKNSCTFAGQLPSIGLEVDGRKVLAEVNVVTPDYIALGNIRVMGSRGWSHYKSGEWYDARAKKADAFCKMALGEKFASHEHHLKGGSPKFKETAKVTYIACARKGLDVAKLPPGDVVMRKPLSAELSKRISAGKGSKASQ